MGLYAKLLYSQLVPSCFLWCEPLCWQRCQIGPDLAQSGNAAGLPLWCSGTEQSSDWSTDWSMQAQCVSTGSQASPVNDTGIYGQSFDQSHIIYKAKLYKDTNLPLDKTATYIWSSQLELRTHEQTEELEL